MGDSDDCLQVKKTRAELKSIYNKRKLYVPSHLKFLYSSYKTHLESKKLYQIENWLQYYRGVFKRSIKEAQKISIANTKSMKKYFVTTHKHKSAKKRTRPQYSIQNKK